MDEIGDVTLEVGAGKILKNTFRQKWERKARPNDLYIASDAQYLVEHARKTPLQKKIRALFKHLPPGIVMNPSLVFETPLTHLKNFIALKFPVQQIPLKDGSVSHIVAKDLYGDWRGNLSPMLALFLRKDEGVKAHEFSKAIENMQQSVSEFDRLLKPGGRITLIEKQTPQYAYLSHLGNLLRMRNYRVMWVGKNKDAELTANPPPGIKTNILIAIKPKSIRLK